jgi:hypothetical protein
MITRTHAEVLSFGHPVLDGPFISFWFSLQDCEIGLRNLVPASLKLVSDFRSPREEEYAGGLAVKPVQHKRASCFLACEMSLQPGERRVELFRIRGNREKPGGFIDGNEIMVHPDDRDSLGFRFRIAVWRVVIVDRNAIAGPERMIVAGRRGVVDGHSSRVEELLDSRAIHGLERIEQPDEERCIVRWRREDSVWRQRRIPILQPIVAFRSAKGRSRANENAN